MKTVLVALLSLTLLTPSHSVGAEEYSPFHEDWSSELTLEELGELGYPHRPMSRWKTLCGFVVAAAAGMGAFNLVYPTSQEGGFTKYYDATAARNATFTAAGPVTEHEQFRIRLHKLVRRQIVDLTPTYYVQIWFTGIRWSDQDGGGRIGTPKRVVLAQTEGFTFAEGTREGDSILLEQELAFTGREIEELMRRTGLEDPSLHVELIKGRPISWPAYQILPRYDKARQIVEETNLRRRGESQRSAWDEGAKVDYTIGREPIPLH